MSTTKNDLRTFLSKKGMFCYRLTSDKEYWVYPHLLISGLKVKQGNKVYILGKKSLIISESTNYYDHFRNSIIKPYSKILVENDIITFKE